MTFVRSAKTFVEWRDAARPLLAGGVPPEAIEWAAAALIAAAAAPMTQPPAPTPIQAKTPAQAPRLPRISARLLRLLETLSMYRTAGRWELMYRLAWRSLNGRPRLLDDAADPDVRHASLMERAVNRDVHKMHAFVRFRETRDESEATVYFAWFEPQHEILRRGAAFFARRFPNHDWTIATPDGAALWKLRRLHFVASPDPEDRPRADECEDLWRTYYRNICNVARINPLAMQREMPRRYWRHLPEAVEIDPLLRDGVADFIRRQHESPDAGRPMPLGVRRALPDPADEAQGPQTCRRCDLWRHATQAVAGEGVMAPGGMMLVGEQPGDEEDLRGRPFVGPAGKVLDRAVDAAGLDRRRLFITNAVKHFKWEPRGKRRLHKRPGTAEMQACNIWLEQEIAAMRPTVIVALGATALRALTAATLSLEDARLRTLRHPAGARIVATYHPAAILRAAGGHADELAALLEADLRVAAVVAASATVTGAPTGTSS